MDNDQSLLDSTGDKSRILWRGKNRWWRNYNRTSVRNLDATFPVSRIRKVLPWSPGNLDKKTDFRQRIYSCFAHSPTKRPLWLHLLQSGDCAPRFCYQFNNCWKKLHCVLLKNSLTIGTNFFSWPIIYHLHLSTCCRPRLKNDNKISLKHETFLLFFFMLPLLHTGRPRTVLLLALLHYFITI